MAPAQLRDDIDAIRAATNRAFQVNFFVHDAPDRKRDAGDGMRAKLAAYYEEAGLGDRNRPSLRFSSPTRRSGCFPALPYPPLRPANML